MLALLVNGGEDSLDPVAILLEEVRTAGAADALEQALGATGLDAPPAEVSDLLAFVTGPLDEALVGHVHPATASHLIETVRERVARVDQSHMRVRAGAAPSENEAITQPPPPDPAASEQSYQDLATGAIHERATPAWGIRAPVGPGAEWEGVWAIVSNERAMVETAQLKAPSSIDVVPASSMAVLKGALSRGGDRSAVVVDAKAPSIPVDRTIRALTSTDHSARVVLWRMTREERGQLHEREPSTRSWLPCDHEVTPEEILRLLGI